MHRDGQRWLQHCPADTHLLLHIPSCSAAPQGLAAPLTHCPPYQHTKLQLELVGNTKEGSLAQGTQQPAVPAALLAQLIHLQLPLCPRALNCLAPGAVDCGLCHQLLHQHSAQLRNKTFAVPIGKRVVGICRAGPRYPYFTQTLKQVMKDRADKEKNCSSVVSSHHAGVHIHTQHCELPASPMPALHSAPRHQGSRMAASVSGLLQPPQVSCKAAVCYSAAHRAAGAVCQHSWSSRLQLQDVMTQILLNIDLSCTHFTWKRPIWLYIVLLPMHSSVGVHLPIHVGEKNEMKGEKITQFLNSSVAHEFRE